MKPEDRGCFNCEASLLCKVPVVEMKMKPGEDYKARVSEESHWGLMSCRQKLSDHYKHYVELTHVCAWHSDWIKNDERYSNWRETIDLPKEVKR